MRVIAVDDEQIILADFMNLLDSIDIIEQVEGFTDEEDAIDYVKENEVDVAFLDVRMNGMGGLELAKVLQEICPLLNVIFLTGYMEYGYDAMRQHASGYLLKPPVKEEVERELGNLRNPLEKKEKKDIMIHTFGNFDVFVEERPVAFRHKRAKELLANLVHHRGETVTRKEIAADIFEDKEYSRLVQNQIQKALVDLQKELKENQLERLLIIGSNCYSVDANLFDCDYYQFLEKDAKAVDSYQGAYLENYSWAETTNGWLLAEKEKMD